MKPELEKQIIDVAPYMFLYDGHDDINRSCLAWGFECGDGWFELIKELVTKLAEIDVDKKIIVEQVKAKFSTLRFYIGGTEDERAYRLEYEYEAKSEHICEGCGADHTGTSKRKHICLPKTPEEYYVNKTVS